MAKVFIGGSRQVAGLEAAVCDRLDRIVTKGLPVLVGDAGGVDEAVQRYFRGRGYVNVTVFSADPRPRHNVGGWPVRVVPPGRAGEGPARHASKDRAMAAEATVGLMLWDGPAYRALGVRDGDEIIWFWIGSHTDYGRLLTELALR